MVSGVFGGNVTLITVSMAKNEWLTGSFGAMDLHPDNNSGKQSRIAHPRQQIARTHVCRATVKADKFPDARVFFSTKEKKFFI